MIASHSTTAIISIVGKYCQGSRISPIYGNTETAYKRVKNIKLIEYFFLLSIDASNIDVVQNTFMQYLYKILINKY